MGTAFIRLPQALRLLLIVLGLALLYGCERDHDPRDDEAPMPVPLQATTKGAEANPDQGLAERARALPSSGKDEADGVEAGSWAVQPEGNPGRVDLITLTGEKMQNTRRLALTIQAGDKGYAAFRREGQWALKTGAQDRTMLVAYNDTGGALRCSIAYSFSADFIWYESTPRELKAGWNTIEIAQGASDFKTRSSKWEHNAALWKPEDCRAIVLVFHTGKRTGLIFVDRLSLEGTDTSRK